MPKPAHLDLDKTKGLTVTWDDGRSTFYPIAYLRRLSPSADMKKLREDLATNPLTVLPSSAARETGPLTATKAELVGNYAIRIYFSDGHSAGLYTWDYLKQIAPPPGSAPDKTTPPGGASS